MEKTTKNTSLGIALGMCFGVSLGSAFGVVFDNIAVGISMGISIGMALGIGIGSLKDKMINEQLEEKGYTIKTIEEKEDKQEYMVTIVDKSGEEILIQVTKSQMKAAAFTIGDVVFLNKAGQIEPAFNKQE